nr:MAG TPA: hypothetical protein [Caudoviricetes sp.]
MSGLCVDGLVFKTQPRFNTLSPACAGNRYTSLSANSPSNAPLQMPLESSQPVPEPHALTRLWKLATRMSPPSPPPEYGW